MLEIEVQPDDATCGPTCLHAVYRHFGDALPLDSVIGEVEAVATGGTLGVNLARHALRRGYSAAIYTYNLDIFDPTWFVRPSEELPRRLRAQAEHKRSARLREATSAYLDFLELGGQVHHEELSRAFLARLLDKGPVITGLSATYLYGCAREADDADGRTYYDDVRGTSSGHFVVLYGYHPEQREVLVADPLRENPRFGDQNYAVGVHRLVGAIMLGVLSFDGNLLALEPADGRPPARTGSES